ncbi:2OG-Fe(II) oxygenase superfamily protein [Rutstroemia sp. NJR-2017a BVV2]|nr:2OG-Fe(II) oxygenase superfamily protein [Rutstroemia sp. NJR-2017a BVV2]
MARTQGDDASEPEVQDSNDDDQNEESVEIEARNDIIDADEETDSDTEKHPPDDLKTDLRDYLESLEIGGQFAHHGSIIAAPNPGLSLIDHGTVGFPLCQYDFDKIIAASGDIKQAAGSTDSVALTLPKQCWSVPESRFRLANPAWLSMLQSIMAQIQIELGLGDRKLLSILLELVLYEAGSTLETYQPRRPSTHAQFSSLKNVPSAFALVDIILPSARIDGGDITYAFGDQIKTLSIPQVSEWDCSYLARFTDVSVKSPPLNSGKRLVLRYVLEQTSLGPSCSAGNIASALADLGSMLRAWNKNRGIVEEYLAYALEESYGDNLAHKDLKGKDRFIVDQLKSAARDEGFYVCLAKLQCEIQGRAEAHEDYYDDYWGHEYDSDSGGHHEMEDVDANYLTLEQVFTLDGQDECAKPLFYQESNILQDGDLFEGQDPDSEDYDKDEGYLTHFYRGSLPATLSNLPQDVQGDLKYLCEELVKRMQSLPYGSIPYGLSASVFLRILEGIVELDLKNLCELAMPAFFFIEGGISWITKMTERHGVPWCKTIITNRISNIMEFSARCALIAQVSEFLQNPEWSLTQYELSVSSLEFNTTKDAENLLQIAKTWNEKQLLKIVVPSVKRGIQKTQAMSSLLSGIAKARLNSEAVSEPLDIVFQEAFLGAVGALGLEQHDNIDKPPPPHQTTSYSYYIPLNNRKDDPPAYKNLASVICFAYKLGMNPELENLFLTISSQAAEADDSAFPGRFLSFLRSLASTIHETLPVGLEISTFQSLFQSILSSCVEKTMFKEPDPPKDWKREKRGCGCDDCKLMDAFLVHPDKQVDTFYINGQRRKHLSTQLSRCSSYDPSQKHIDLSESRIKSPFGLVVKKVLDFHHSRVSRWRKDGETMRTIIRDLAPPADLKKLLGDYYDTLVVQGIPISATPPGETSLPKATRGSLLAGKTSTAALKPSSGNVTAAGSSNKKRSAPSSVDGREDGLHSRKKRQATWKK